MGDRVQMQEMHSKLEAVAKLPVEKQAEAKAKIEAGKVDYLTQPMLADLEQGWGDPKKVYLSVIRCLQNGVNIMHIEVGEFPFLLSVSLSLRHPPSPPSPSLPLLKIYFTLPPPPLCLPVPSCACMSHSAPPCVTSHLIVPLCAFQPTLPVPPCRINTP